MAALIQPAKAAGLKVHLDGARIANAAAAGFPLKTLKTLGVDIAVLGGTKAGSTPSEAIVLFDTSLARRFDARMKHGGQLVSKARYLAAPWIGMLETGAWTTRAAHANAMARKLAALSPFPLAHAVETNGVFVTMDEGGPETPPPGRLARLPVRRRGRSSSCAPGQRPRRRWRNWARR